MQRRGLGSMTVKETDEAFGCLFWFITFWLYLIVLTIKTIIVGIIKIFNNRKNIKYYQKENLIEKIDNMTGQEFEQILIKLLLNQGYTDIEGTKYTGDYGVDIVACKDGLKCAIQCKRFNDKVSVHAVQEIVAGRKHYKCDKAIVITNNYYTNNAKTLAFSNKVELWDRDNVIQLVKDYE